MLSKIKNFFIVTLPAFLAAMLVIATSAAEPILLKRDSSLYSKHVDPFTPYLTIVPEILDTISSKQSGSGAGAILTREIVYSSKNNINRIYAIIASPQRAGRFPALLILHGGSGSARGLMDVVEKYARKGYVAIACDMAGYSDIESTPYSSGPWKANPAPDEGPRFNIADGLANSSLVDAEVAGLNAFNLLRAQPNVDVNRIGITGYSWGGYSTTMLCGLLGDKVKAAYSYWGCGYYDEGSFWQGIIQKMPAVLRQQWLTYFDAGRRAAQIKAHYFIEAASNDTYFWPDAVKATLRAIPGAKNNVWGPNVNHALTPRSSMMQELYFDYYLKDQGSPFITAGISKIDPLNDGSKKISIKLKAPKGIKADTVRLYYSEPAKNWQLRVWVPIVSKKKKKNCYTVVLPADLIRKQVIFYAYVTDSRGVVTSSNLY
jgi:dienelactone hydrolase